MLTTAAILGSSSVVSVVASTVRLKLAALVLGVAGIGLVGLAQNFTATAATLLGLGLGQAAPGQIAKAAQHGAEHDANARNALLIVTVLTAAVASLIVWISRRPAAALLFADPKLASVLGWMGVGVGLTIVASSQTGLLAGVGKIHEVARLSMISAIASTLLGLAALYAWGARAVIPFILATPVVTCLVGVALTSHLFIRSTPAFPRGLVQESRALVSVGLSLSIAATVANGAQLAVRALIHREFGLSGVGLFQAAWAVSTTYLSMVLQAMTVDFFPRLNAAIGRPTDANQLINDQTLVGLLAAGPIILVAIGVTPWALDVLYSSEFGRAAALLRWQLFGDVLRIASWPLGYMLIASRQRTIFMAVEAIAQLAFIGVCAGLLPFLGVEAAGLAFLSMYAIYLPITYVAARRVARFRWTTDVRSRFWLTLVLGGLTVAAAYASDVAAFCVGTGAGAILLLSSIRRLLLLVRVAPITAAP